MAMKVDSFKSDSGKVHEDEHSAWIDDLDHWLGKSGVDNAPIRKTVVDAIKADIANGNHLVAIIEGIKRTAPAPVAAAPAYTCIDCGRIVPNGQECPHCESKGV